MTNYNVVSNDLKTKSKGKNLFEWEEENLFEWEIDEELEVTHETTLNP